MSIPHIGIVIGRTLFFHGTSPSYIGIKKM